MNIALIGYGNMGKTLESLCDDDSEDNITSISFQKGVRQLDEKGIEASQVAIDFTAPHAVLPTIKKLLPLGIPLVIGTTGWFDQLPEVEELVKKHKGAIVYGGNFSIGANIFFQIINQASALFNSFPEYDVYGIEIHHTGKKDSPSGTARTLATIIQKNIARKKTIQMDRVVRMIRPDELHFASVRGGRTNGEHTITFDSTSDMITLSHTAHNRVGFAKGALMAAKFIQGKKGLFRFEDIFQEVITHI